MTMKLDRSPYISPQNITPTKGYSPCMDQTVMLKTTKKGTIGTIKLELPFNTKSQHGEGLPTIVAGIHGTFSHFLSVLAQTSLNWHLLLKWSKPQKMAQVRNGTQGVSGKFPFSG